MTQEQFNYFCQYKDSLKKLCDKIQEQKETLIPLQKAASTVDYPIENCVVYNSSYDLVTKNDEIKIILVGDNPGQKEQLNINKKYLCGLSGKLAEKFFTEHPSLQTDFRKNVIITNKTPLHTARTVQLKNIAKNGGEKIKQLIIESQIQMAQMTFELHKNLGKNCQLWIIGYSEMKKNGIFEAYTNELKKLYKDSELWNQLFIYQHFSMNRFTIDLRNCIEEKKQNDIQKALTELGTKHKLEVLA